MDGFPGLLVKVVTYGGRIAGLIFVVVWLIHRGLLSFSLSVGKPRAAPTLSHEPPINQRRRSPREEDHDDQCQISASRPRTRTKTASEIEGKR
jgi:hypothetical protein